MQKIIQMVVNRWLKFMANAAITKDVSRAVKRNSGTEYKKAVGSPSLKQKDFCFQKNSIF